MTPEELVERAGVPAWCPAILKPGEVEALFRWTRDDRLSVERVGALEPMPRDIYQQRRYRKVDVARFIVDHAQPAWWDEMRA